MADGMLLKVITQGLARADSARGQGGAKSSIAGWIGKTIGLSDTSFWGAWLGSSSSGRAVTAHSALTVSAVWSCVRLIAQTIATLPFDFYQRTANAPIEAGNHPLYELLRHQPNSDMTAVQFWEVVLASLLLWGNSFAEKRMVGGRIVAIDFLMPWRMLVRRLQDGSLEYRYTDVNGTQRVIPEGAMWHITGFSLDGVMGISTIRYGANVIGAALAADEASSKIFANGLNVGGVLSTDKLLNAAQRQELSESMASKFTGAMNAGKTMVLEAGMKYQQVPMNPEDAQLLATRGFNVEEVCRWFNVPPWMVGHTEKSTSWGSGIEQQMIGFLTFAIRPWLTRIEHSIRKSLLKPGEKAKYFAKFAVEGLLRADSAARSSFYSTMVQNGIYTRDDCREKENLPRRGGNADELTVQSNLLPIEKLGAAAGVDQAAKNALADWLGILPKETEHAS